MAQPKPVKLTVAQIELVRQFNDYAFENRGLSFDVIAKRVLGPNLFSKARSGKKFRAECKKAFDLEQRTHD